MKNYALVIHGDAKSGSPGDLEEGVEDRLSALSDILRQSFPLLANGGSALDAVTMAVGLLEDCPLFNAGKGAVLTTDGTAELDASLMDGKTGRFGGVTNVKTIRNPIMAARLVMNMTPHAIMCAEKLGPLATQHGLDIVNNDYFIIDRQRTVLEKSLEAKSFSAINGLGTVGAVALDKDGNLAAATSTGGLTGKLPGRVSDSSIAGAGTWATNGVCALSCTGTGDVFIRNATARDAACLIEYKGMSLEESCKAALEKVRKAGGAGGMIGIDSRGNISTPFNTSGMYRGHMRSGHEKPTVRLLSD